MMSKCEYVCHFFFLAFLIVDLLFHFSNVVKSDISAGFFLKLEHFLYV